MHTLREAAIEVIDAITSLIGAGEEKRWRTEHRSAYQALVYSMQQRLEGAVDAADDGWVLTDRGLFDGLAYCIEDQAAVPWELAEAVILRRPAYEAVFVVETPPESAFRGRSPRERSVSIGRRCEQVYRALGYSVSWITFDTVDRRCDAIVSQLDNSVCPDFPKPAF
jgi:predicted ATPase